MKFTAWALIAFLSLGFTAPENMSTPKEFIPWNAERPLQWDDFKAKPLDNDMEAAMTASSIEFTYETNGKNVLRWHIDCRFFPGQSWSKKDHQTALILKHEQLHFDITEIYARLMRKYFLESIKSVQDIPKFKSISKQIMLAWNQEENNYDFETKHSMNTERQQEWNQSVAERLDALKDYTGTSFAIPK